MSFSSWMRLCGVVVGIGLFAAAAMAEERAAMRPPAVPLVVHDPYFSIWSFNDKLTDGPTRHWTGTPYELCSLIRIDGKTYRLMGAEPKDLPALEQTKLVIWPTRTIYQFCGAGVKMQVTFISPLMPHDLDMFSRPVSYITWAVKSTDGKQHTVALYFDMSASLAVNEPKQKVEWSRPEIGGMNVAKIGSKDQPVLEKSGDNLRIDWGYLYLAADKELNPVITIAANKMARDEFIATGKISDADDTRMPRAVEDETPVAACTFDLDSIGEQLTIRWLMLAYDDEYSIEYLGQKLRPYWRRNGMDAAKLLSIMVKRHAHIYELCWKYDHMLMTDLTAVGGPRYANLCALSYRQALGAHKLVALPDGRPMLFSKENFSNGCTGTVDVIYPAAPIFMLFNKELLKASLTPVFEYAATPRWRFPYAPHDVGQYPKANGQVYGGGEKSERGQMPVEESANMLLMAAAVCQLDGNTEYVDRYWKLLERWAEYLKEKGLDPANQLCTDDFAGHLAHNANLSIKAILALGAYAKMCDMAGKKEAAAEYRRTAEQFAKEWIKMADDGDHFRLAFDKPGTWSQKYNLVWDKLLKLNLFPPEVAAKEIAFYKTKLGRFGLPLDSRKTYTKTDWQVWTATLAGSRADFDALMNPVYDFVDQTPDRVPLTDWYETTDAKKSGFQARPVIGGVFIKMLDDPAIWAKWLERGGAK
jgi:hypothetical protein